MQQGQIQRQNRKVQVSGRCSYIVSLPKKWVNDMGITRGSRVQVTWHNSTSLLLSASRPPDASPLEKKLTILPVSETESPTTTALKVANLYISGRNSIQLKFTGCLENAEKRSEISNLVRNQLMGAEIISDSQDGLRVEILLGNSDLTIENAVKRLSSVSSLMLEDAIESFRMSDRNLAREVVENFEAERFSYYVERSIHGSLGHTAFKEGDVSEPSELGIYLLISRAFLDSAKCAKEIAGQVVAAEESSPLGFDEALAINQLKEFILQAYHSAVLSFFKRDAKSAEKTLEMARQFQKIKTEILKDLGKRTLPNGDHLIAVVAALSSLKKTCELSSEVAEHVMELLQEKFVQTESVGTAPLESVPLLASVPHYSVAKSSIESS